MKHLIIALVMAVALSACMSNKSSQSLPGVFNTYGEPEFIRNDEMIPSNKVYRLYRLDLLPEKDEKYSTVRSFPPRIYNQFSLKSSKP